MLIQIKVTLISESGVHNIFLPQFQNEFSKTLSNMEIYFGKNTEYIITNVVSNIDKINDSIKDSNDLDDLNFLAQILSFFYEDELKTFEAIISYFDEVLSLEKLINIAYNFFDLEIISSLKTGSVLSDERCLKNTSNTLDSSLNNNLIDLFSRKNKSIKQSLLTIDCIPNLYLILENSYNENFFLDYDYSEDFILKLRVSAKHNNKTVEFSIPATKNVVARALKRLNVDSLDECIITRFSSWNFDEITNVEWNDNSIEKLNALVKKIKKINHNDIMDYLKGVRHTRSIKSIDSLYIYTNFFNESFNKTYY